MYPCRLNVAGRDRTEVPPARLAKEILSDHQHNPRVSHVHKCEGLAKVEYCRAGGKFDEPPTGAIETVTPLYNVMSDQTWVERRPGTDYRLTLTRLVIGDEVSLACRNAIYVRGRGTDICFFWHRDLMCAVDARCSRTVLVAGQGVDSKEQTRLRCIYNRICICSDMQDVWLGCISSHRPLRQDRFLRLAVA